MIDAHLHLQDPRLEPVRDAYLSSLPRLGIEAIVVNGTCESDWDGVEGLAARNSRVIPFFGLHPWKAGSATENWARDLKQRLEGHPGAGIGEIGLDRWIRDGDFERQKEVFATQLALSRDLSRPTAIHCLQAWGTLLEMFREAMPEKPFLLHSFGGPPEMIRDFTLLGAYFSISGYFFRPDKTQKLKTFAAIPPDRLLIETDAPDMAPPRSDRQCLVPGEEGNEWNHPGNLPAIHKTVANWLGITTGELKERMRNNFEAWYGAPVPGG